MSRYLPQISNEHMHFYLKWLLPQYLNYINSKHWTPPSLTLPQLVKCSTSQDQINSKICGVPALSDAINSQLDDKRSIQCIPSTEDFQYEQGSLYNSANSFRSLPLQSLTALAFCGLLTYVVWIMTMMAWYPFLLITIMLLYWLILTIFGTEVFLHLMSRDGI